MPGGAEQQIITGPRCSSGVEHGQQIINLGDTMKELKEETEKQWDAIEKLRNRLPVWATLFISSLTCIAGILIGLLIAYGESEV